MAKVLSCTTPAVNTTPKRLLRLPETMKKSGLGRASIYAFMKDGKFPQSISLGERSVAWLESEIDSWIESRVSLRG